jgi:hypothetical protein
MELKKFLTKGDHSVVRQRQINLRLAGVGVWPEGWGPDPAARWQTFPEEISTFRALYGDGLKKVIQVSKTSGPP